MNALNDVKSLATRSPDAGKVEIPLDSRARMLKLLEILLVDEEALLLYCGELGAQSLNLGPAGPLPPGLESTITQRDWNNLSNESLSDMMLHPAMLILFGRKIREDFPMKWLPILDRYHDRILDELALESHKDQTLTPPKDDSEPLLSPAVNRELEQVDSVRGEASFVSRFLKIEGMILTGQPPCTPGKSLA